MTKKASEILLRIWILTFSVGITKLGPIPIKTLIFALFSVASIYLLAKKNRIIVKQGPGLLVLFFWLIVATNIGFFNGFNYSTVSQSSSLLATFMIVIFSFLLHKNGLLNAENIKNSIYLSAALGAIIKISLGLGVVFGFLSAENIDDLMQNYIGSTSFQADAFGGFMGLLPRIGNAGDLFNLVVFLFYIKKNSGARVALAWALMLVFVLVTYSRYLILLFVIATLYATGSNIKEKSKAVMVATALIALAVTIHYTEADVIFAEFEERFTGYTQNQSDQIREEQKLVLLRSFGDSPIFGAGLGGYERNYIRSPSNLWQYEMEYLSLLMQLGVLGFILIVANFVLYVFRMLTGYDKIYFVPMAISMIFWIGTPVQSSIFSGTQSAVILLSIFFLSRKIAIRESDPGRRTIQPYTSESSLCST